MLAIGFININPQCIFDLGEMGLNGINDGVAGMRFTMVDGFLQLNSVRYLGPNR